MRTFSANVSGRPRRSTRESRRARGTRVHGFDELDGGGGDRLIQACSRDSCIATRTRSRMWCDRAGYRCSEYRTGVPSASAWCGDNEQRGLRHRCRAMRGRGVGDLGGDRLLHRAERDAVHGQQVVERRVFDIGARSIRAEIAADPHDDERERIVVGEVQALDAQHVGAASRVSAVRDRRRPGRTRTPGSCGPASRPAASTAASIVVTRPSGWRTGSSARTSRRPAGW